MLRAESEAMIVAPNSIAVSTGLPKRKFGILEAILAGKTETAKTLRIKCKITTPVEMKKAKIALIPILTSSFTAKIAMKSKTDKTDNEPDVPSSKISPATDLITSPEKKEDTKAMTGKITIGIKNFDFGI